MLAAALNVKSINESQQTDPDEKESEKDNEPQLG